MTDFGVRDLDNLRDGSRQATPERQKRANDRTYETTAAFVAFLQRHELVKEQRRADPDGVPDDFTIRTRDLAEDGVSLILDGFDRWPGSLDDDRTPVSVKSLERPHKKRSS